MIFIYYYEKCKLINFKNQLIINWAIIACEKTGENPKCQTIKPPTVEKIPLIYNPII